MIPSLVSFFYRHWPVTLFVAILLLCDFSIPFVFRRTSFNQEVLTLYVGSVFGQMLLNSLIGGCFGRSWLKGVLVATILSMSGFAVGISGAMWDQIVSRTWSDVWWPEFCILALAPLLTLAGSAPMLGMRQMCGWTLTTVEFQEVPRSRSSLEDILSVTVVTASFLMFAQLFMRFGIQGQRDGVRQLLIATVCFSLYSLFALLPATWLAFRQERWTLRLIGWLGLCLVGFVAIVVLNWNVNPDDFSSRDCLYVFLAITGIFATAASGFTILRFDGVRLTSFGESRASPNPEARRNLRILTACVFSIAVVVNVSLSALEAQFRRTEAMQDAMARDLMANGGKLVTSNRRIMELAVGKNANDEVVRKYLDHNRNILKLSLADSQITNAFVNHLSTVPLQSLDLSGTRITDEFLDSLRPLNRLSLARTQISPKAVASYLGNQHWRMKELDLTDLKLTDENLEMFSKLVPTWTPAPANIPLPNSLILRHNPITDNGVRWLQNQTFERLDLSYTDVDGSGLRPGMANHYVLDGTKVTDATVLSLLTGGTVVSLKDTSVTESVLGASGENGFILANCGIAESDLEGFGPLRLRLLHLAGKEFTGTCFRNVMLQARTIDMSHSGVTDETVRFLLNRTWLSHLNLSNTALTDSALPTLSRIQVSELDLRNTKITAAALKKTQFDTVHRIILSWSQFSFSEIQILQRIHPFVFDEDTPYYGN